MFVLKFFGACALFSVASFAAMAQNLPAPKEFYFDDDRSTARQIVVVEQQQGDALAEALVKEREHGRKPVEATAQLAHVAMSEGRGELGGQLYRQAISNTSSQGPLARAIRWNYGWDLYRAGQYEPALQQWGDLAHRFGSPAWLPPTLALVLWKLDRKADALKWYAAAVRTEPDLWRDPANYAQLLPDWSDQERSTLAEVKQAWESNPPAWP